MYTLNCGGSGILKIILYVKTLLKIISIVIPIILILMVSIDFGKNVINGDEKEQKKSYNMALKRCIAAVVVFFIPVIAKMFMNMLGDYRNDDWIVCYNLATKENIETVLEDEKEANRIIEDAKQIEYERLAAEREARQAVIRAEREERERIKAEEARLEAEQRKAAEQQQQQDNVVGGSIGKAYALTDAQLLGLARVCQREQGDAAGAAAEATLIVNQFELYENVYNISTTYGTGGTGIYNYVADGPQFGNSRPDMENSNNTVSNEVIAAVKNVIVFGNRSLPGYIVEHDCIYCGSYGWDVRYIVTNGNTITSESGRLDRNNYISGNTIIYNRYGSVYTFYAFPTEYSDPFGYTDYAMNEYNRLNNIN